MASDGELEKYKKPDGTIDWGRLAMDRIERLPKKPDLTNGTNGSNGTDGTNKKPGGYRNLIVYQQAVVIYDLTTEFCKRFLDSQRDKRTIEQMVQAARSGKQNIVEGSLEKSLKMNIKLTGVARASFGELLEDYKDFLRTRVLPLWGKDDARVREIRSWRIRPAGSNGADGANWRKNWFNWANGTDLTNWTDSPERFANLMVTLISKENYLLDKMIRVLEEKFIREGGYSERLSEKRKEEKKRQIASW